MFFSSSVVLFVGAVHIRLTYLPRIVYVPLVKCEEGERERCEREMRRHLFDSTLRAVHRVIDSSDRESVNKMDTGRSGVASSAIVANENIRKHEPRPNQADKGEIKKKKINERMKGEEVTLKSHGKRIYRVQTNQNIISMGKWSLKTNRLVHDSPRRAASST